MDGIDKVIEQFGGDPKSLVRFDVEGPDLLPYATITTARSSGDSDLVAIRGVYEWQDRPLLFVVDGGAPHERRVHLDRVRRLVAMRGDAPYIGVVTPGNLTVYNVGLADSVEQARVSTSSEPAARRVTIPHLGNARPDISNNRYWISDVILRLLTGALDDLEQASVDDEDSISLVGRALFVRFLEDRNLLPKTLLKHSAGEAASLFDDARRTILISNWLDSTFNGDFLPISDAAIRKLPKETFSILGNILRRAPNGQLQLGWQEKWDMLDFAHIPVGVLSQAYERYLGRHAPTKQHKEGSYYTPRHIADLMVRASFSALRRDGTAHRAKVLDPAAGAGVFLLTAFRHLVGERWRHDQRRPDTATLREILYNQIKGFDINESALRFAALGLYLISIELDPNPEPIQKLKFKNLRPQVLQKFGGKSHPKGSACLGSLGDEPGEEHLGAYDLVIGNPPWATSTKLPDWPLVQNRVQHIAGERLQDNRVQAPIPNEVLDLPFVWRAMEWARPQGQIAFALHARLLFQRGEAMPIARSVLFRALDVTGVVNGTELRKSRVWPEITAPFCLLFARNGVPAPGAGFRFTSPYLEEALNRGGAWRVDVANAEIVASEELCRRPALLKTLFRGTRLDLELYDRIVAKGFPTLEHYWRETFGIHRGRPRLSGNGYQRLRPSSRVRKNATQPGVSARYLHDFSELSAESAPSLVIHPSETQPFKLKRIHDRRPKELFAGPLLLVRESPPVEFGRIRASVSSGDLVFNQSYHGYSTREHTQASLLARYLALVIGSKISLWHALITSGRFGFEREVVEKFVIDELPIPRFEFLSPLERQTANDLFDALSLDDSESQWERVDSWVTALFGLGSHDLAIISDTLKFRLPFSSNQRAAQQPITAAQYGAFRKRLKADLKPWGDRFKRPIEVSGIEVPSVSPWRFIHLGERMTGDVESEMAEIGMQAIAAADEASATEVVVVTKASNSLVVGRWIKLAFGAKAMRGC